MTFVSNLSSNLKEEVQVMTIMNFKYPIYDAHIGTVFLLLRLRFLPEI